MREMRFPLAAFAVAAVFFAGAHALRSDYFFYAGYTVLQFVVLASAWNILGGYVGYLPLRLRGIFFAIATFAVAVVAQTLITNWDFVGGSAGVYVLRPKHIP